VSRLISDILQAPEPAFSHALQEWERLSGRAGHDVRLVAEIAAARRRAMQELNLDEADTTPKEFYYALRHRATETSRILDRHMCIGSSDTPAEVVSKVVSFVEKMEVSRDVWRIKQPVVKQLIKKQPPKKLLKCLGLRSIESVLKRVNASELLSLSYKVETPEWTVKMHNQFKKLTPGDLHTDKSCIYVVEADRQAKLQKGGLHHSNIINPNYETGSVVLLTAARRFPLDTLALTLGLLDSLYQLRAYSAYFRHLSVKGNFGEQLHEAIHRGLPGNPQELRIGWKALQKHFSHHPEAFSRIEQPHLHIDDVSVSPPLQSLAKSVPELSFWADHELVFMPHERTQVSANLMDVVVNGSNNIPFEESRRNYLKSHLWEELGRRYLTSEPVVAIVIEDIER
jgi:hypothetical protein